MSFHSDLRDVALTVIIRWPRRRQIPAGLFLFFPFQLYYVINVFDLSFIQIQFIVLPLPLYFLRYFFLRHTGQKLLNSLVYNYNMAYLNNSGMDVTLSIWFCSLQSSLLHEKCQSLIDWGKKKKEKSLSSWRQNMTGYPDLELKFPTKSIVQCTPSEKSESCTPTMPVQH